MPSPTLAHTEARLRQAGLRRSEAELARASAAIALTQAICAAQKAGMPKTEIARLAGVSRQTVHNILSDWQ